MKTYAVEASRLFKEVGAFYVEAKDREEARDIAEMMLRGDDTDCDWSQEGIEDERIESITEIDS